MKNHKKIIDKICKCLRLSESSNVNEAALALRHAGSLMEKYGVTNAEVLSAEITECVTEVGERYTPPFWALALANLVAEAFQCRNLISRCYGRRPEFRFIGMGYKAEVALYSYTVLHRQLLKSIEEFTSSIPKTCEKNELENQQRIDVFAQAWLFRIGRTVTEFSSESADKKVIDDYIESKYGAAVELSSEASETESEHYDDILHGMRAANDVELYHCVQQFNESLYLQHKHAS